MEKRGTSRTTIQAQKEDELWQMDFTKNKAWWMEMAILKFPGATVWDIANRYTSDIVLNQ
jgi:hypothetical protein